MATGIATALEAAQNAKGSAALSRSNAAVHQTTVGSPALPTPAPTSPATPSSSPPPPVTVRISGSATSPPTAPPDVAPKTSPIANGTASPHLTPGKPLAGMVVAVDPGHDGGNAAAPGVINQMIWNGRAPETCDTTGTQTDSGYTEALFNFNVAQYLAADLQAEGATVVLTRTSNSGVGPCVTDRAAIGNEAHANVAISIHADGGPPTGRGFAILEPVADGPNNAIIGSSQTLGLDLRSTFLTLTGEPVSTYDGVDGIQARSDLAGLNLSTVPKVLIECANMRNTTDAALLTTTPWQETAARAIAAGLTTFLAK
jgi:N-acetylmuramoyl-L-alanine amidase